MLLNLNFDYTVNKLSKKLNTLARIAKYMDISKWRVPMKAFVPSVFLLPSEEVAQRCSMN